MQINSAKDLDVYKKAYFLAMKLFELSKAFPADERFALTSQNPPIFSLDLFEFAGSVGKTEI